MMEVPAGNRRGPADPRFERQDYLFSAGLPAEAGEGCEWERRQGVVENLLTISTKKPGQWVRKVMGASVVSLWGMLSKDFLRLVILSLLLAMPVAWYLMSSWLQKYQYRSTMAW